MKKKKALPRVNKDFILLLEADDAAAWDRFVLDFSFDLRRTILSVCNDYSMSELQVNQLLRDALHRIWVKLCDEKSFKDKENPEAFSTWVCRIAKNVAYEAVKKQKTVSIELLVDTGVEITLITDEPSPEQQIVQAELEAELESKSQFVTSHLNSAIAALLLRPDHEQIVRAWLNDATIRDIALQYGFSESNVRKIVQRVRKRLRQWFEAKGLAYGD